MWCVIQTGRLDKEAVLQLQQGMKHLNVREHSERQSPEKLCNAFKYLHRISYAEQCQVLTEDHLTLQDTIADLETISRLNAPSTQPNSARMSPAVEGLGEHTVVTGEHCDWPMPFPSTRPSDSDYVMPAVSTQRARRRPWSWKVENQHTKI